MFYTYTYMSSAHFLFLRCSRYFDACARFDPLLVIIIIVISIIEYFKQTQQQKFNDKFTFTIFLTVESIEESVRF